MISCEVKIRVRYGETDRMGYAYYGVYPLYYEVGRTELLRQQGLTYKDLEDSGILLPVQSLNIEYIAPAIYDDLLTVKTTIAEKPCASIKFIYEIYNSASELLNKAESVLVFVKSETRKPCRPPVNFSKSFDIFF
jgi:acyl-CoA thioester hydrolase